MSNWKLFGLAALASSLLSGTASVRAADLAAAEPVEYVKICDAYGAGYFFIPGSNDTCLRVSGYVRAYFFYQGQNTSNVITVGRNGGAAEIITPTLLNPTNLNTGLTANGVAVGGGTGAQAFSTAGTAAANAANYSFYGTTQATGRGANTVIFGNAEANDQYVSGIRSVLRFDARTKTQFGILRSFFEFASDTNNSARNGTPLQVRYGFVQFGPITAGVTDSFFNFDNYPSGSFTYAGSRTQRDPVLAYTASLGNGWSATISAEESGSKNNSIGGSNAQLIIGGGDTWVRRSIQLPDLVGNIRLAQSWGTAQIAAAVTQNRFANTTCNSAVALGAVCTANRVGWAVTGGINVNLPTLAKGDFFLVKATYAEGATNYLGHVNLNRSYFANGGGTNDNTLSTITGFSLFGAFNHFWTPALRSVIAGSYFSLGGRPGANFGSNVALLRDGWGINTQLSWSPVRNFDVSLELFYQEATYGFFAGGATGAAALGVGALGSAKDSNAGGALRIQRAF
ncbi:MAG: porin [Hyphomicrobiales bacterium]|nr:porin [Hyphomicrobiales bacterium]